MPNLIITPTNVKMTASSIASVETAGEPIVAGQPCYRKNSEWFLAEAGDTQEKAGATGIAVTSTNAGGKKITICTGGELEMGAVLATNQIYAVSATQGAIAPPDDLVTGNHVTTIGFAKSTTLLIVRPVAQGYQIP